MSDWQKMLRTPTQLGAAVICMALVGGTSAQVADADAAASASPGGSVSHLRPRNYASTLDGRVQLLAKELELDPTQQARVREVLQSQRQQVAMLWNDSSVPAALRVSRTQAIEERTADQIRALLSDEQRKKYIQPRQRPAPVGAPGGDVQKWMKSAQDLDRAQTSSAAVATSTVGGD